MFGRKARCRSGEQRFLDVRFTGVQVRPGVPALVEGMISQGSQIHALQ